LYSKAYKVFNKHTLVIDESKHVTHDKSFPKRMGKVVMVLVFRKLLPRI